MYDSVRGSGRRYGNKRYRGLHRDPTMRSLYNLILALGVLTAVALGTLALVQVRDAPARSFNHLTPPTAGVVDDEWIPPEPILSPDPGGGWEPPAPPRQHPSPVAPPGTPSSTPDPTPTSAAAALTPTPAATGTPAPTGPPSPTSSPAPSARRSKSPRPRVLATAAPPPSP